MPPNNFQPHREMAAWPTPLLVLFASLALAVSHEVLAAPGRGLILSNLRIAPRDVALNVENGYQVKLETGKLGCKDLIQESNGTGGRLTLRTDAPGVLELQVPRGEDPGKVRVRVTVRDQRGTIDGGSATLSRTEPAYRIGNAGNDSAELSTELKIVNPEHARRDGVSVCFWPDPGDETVQQRLVTQSRSVLSSTQATGDALLEATEALTVYLEIVRRGQGTAEQEEEAKKLQRRAMSSLGQWLEREARKPWESEEERLDPTHPFTRAARLLDGLGVSDDVDPTLLVGARGVVTLRQLVTRARVEGDRAAGKRITPVVTELATDLISTPSLTKDLRARALGYQESHRACFSDQPYTETADRLAAALKNANGDLDLTSWMRQARTAALAFGEIEALLADWPDLADDGWQDPSRWILLGRNMSPATAERILKIQQARDQLLAKVDLQGLSCPSLTPTELVAPPPQILEMARQVRDRQALCASLEQEISAIRKTDEALRRGTACESIPQQPHVNLKDLENRLRSCPALPAAQKLAEAQLAGWETAFKRLGEASPASAMSCDDRATASLDDRARERKSCEDGYAAFRAGLGAKLGAATLTTTDAQRYAARKNLEGEVVEVARCMFKEGEPREALSLLNRYDVTGRVPEAAKLQCDINTKDAEADLTRLSAEISSSDPTRAWAGAEGFVKLDKRTKGLCESSATLQRAQQDKILEKATIQHLELGTETLLRAGEPADLISVARGHYQVARQAIALMSNPPAELKERVRKLGDEIGRRGGNKTNEHAISIEAGKTHSGTYLVPAGSQGAGLLLSVKDLGELVVMIEKYDPNNPTLYAPVSADKKLARNDLPRLEQGKAMWVLTPTNTVFAEAGSAYNIRLPGSDQDRMVMVVIELKGGR